MGSFTSVPALLAIACLMLCGRIAQAQTPVISNISPSGAYQFQSANALTFTASSSVGIAPTSIAVQLMGTNLLGQAFSNMLTTANGLVVTGTSTSRSVSAALASNTVYITIILVTNTSLSTASSTVSFDTINPAYTFEAEDYDYNSGHYFDNPQTNAYRNLNAIDGVDAHNQNFSGGASAYRASGLNTENVGDKPRLAYSTGQQDYDVGWNNGGSGNWGNYTRTFPAGAYNIYMRGANPNGSTADSASIALVTSGRGTSSQTITSLGTFSVPNTGSWQTYTWVPLLGANSCLARFTGGSIETLRVSTDNGNYNANLYLLMPADTNLPAISSISPDGLGFFLYTNASATNSLSFVASCAFAIPTNGVVVTLDGATVPGLTFSGSPNSWNVSCPIQPATNHNAVISVTAYNGNTVSTTVNFNYWQPAYYQWEAEDYDYASNGVGGLYFDGPQTNAYLGLPSLPGVDNSQSDLNANPFNYRANSLGPCPATTPAGDEPRKQYATGKTDYNIGFFGSGSWVNYTRHYPAGVYYVWGRFAEGSTTTEATLSQLTSGYGTSSQTTNLVGTFFIPPSGGWSTWEWVQLKDDAANLVKVRFDGSQNTLRLGGSPVAGQPEVNVNFMTLVPTTLDPLAVAQAHNVGTTNVQIVYSRPVESASATNLANYVFTNGLAITGAALAANSMAVTLTTAPLVSGINYCLIINGVRDRMNMPNSIAPNTLVSFQALPYTLYDIGNPVVGSSAAVVGNGIDVSACGSDFGGSSDQGNFSYQIYSGNFDVAVRLAGLGLSDIFARAGLMARETLDPGSQFAAALATPAMNGTSFEWRQPAGTASSSTGNFPANYPNTWLRVQRSGNVFTGYAGYDGQTWTALGSATIAMSNQVYLGFAVSSHSTNQVTTAQFRDLSNVTNAVVATVVNPHEALGPSSRKSPLVFSEIMWKPASRADGKNLEFVELYNSNPWFQDISGYQITCADMNYTFPANTTIAGGGYLVVAAVPADIQSVYGIANVMGPYTGSLKKSESLELIDEHGAILLTVPYSNVYPWPVATGGTGHSLVLANPTYGEADPRAWDISDVVGGSPGQMEAFHPSPLRQVVINEILAHSENIGVPQFIELYNHSTNRVDVSGCILADDANTNKFVIPTGTVLGPAGFVAFTQSQLGFTLNGAGETLFLIKPDGSRVLDAVQFGGQADGVSYGRWPDGANDFYSFVSRTPGTNNAAILIGDVAINELMYNLISGNDDDQYIELYNQGTNTLNLMGWQLTSGVTFTFPNISLAPNGYLVVARNLTNLLAKYPNLSTVNTVGNFSGKLSHNGELLTLVKPAILNGTSTIYVEMDEVTYGTAGRWGEWSAGGGSSLELIDPRANHRLAANWADSDETQKAAWTNIETTGVLDNGANFESTIAHAQIGLLDAGECLVDNIEINYNGSNYVSNSDFESGTNNWSFQGCMARSTLENVGYGGSNHSLHIRSSDHLWTGDNSCQVSLSNTSLQAGQTVTLRFKARWLRGWPEAMLRLNGNWLEAAGALSVPANLGTPGLPNSHAVTNAGPAVYNVTHTPALPAANQAVVVTAKVHDPEGVQTLILYYRLDPSLSYTAVSMKDDGTGGDAVAADGVFSATIPGPAANQIIAFYISATDRVGAATRFPALRPQDNEPARECVVMFGDGNPGGSFGAYHLWVTQTNATRWASLGNLSNEGHDCTIVSGTRVMYNAQARFSGSPYHQSYDTPYGNLCEYKWMFNDDDRFLGATSFNKIHQPGNGPGDDPSLQREQLANTFMRTLGVPWLNRRYVAVYINGSRRGGTLMEDTQCPDADMVKEYFPNDPDGYLYKMQPWFEFAPFLSGESLGFNNENWVTLNRYTTTRGAKKIASYRYNYLVRRTPDSASDFTNVFSLEDAAASYGSANYVANLENIADMENWMRVFAGNHAAGNWDSFGAANGQNLYGYIGTQGTRYSLMMFDFNIVIGNQNYSWAPGQNLFAVNGGDPYLGDMFQTPAFVRMYWRALKELVDGPLNVGNSGPLLDAKYNTFTLNGINAENPNTNIKPWLSQAQASIASQLAAVNATNFTVDSTQVSNNVALVRGTAPVKAQTIWINGAAYPLVWTTLTNWVATVPLQSGTNLLNVVGLDRKGSPIPGDSQSVNVTYNGTNASPVGRLVFNEIMYHPSVDGAQYVELYNTSSNATFDLSGWRLQGLSYTFPSGSILGPTNFLVLAANIPAFAAAYGATRLVLDTFDGSLSSDGELLTLLKPGTNGASDLTVAQVAYEDRLPWPTNGSAGSSSLQLIDPNQDNWRVGNWKMVLGSATPGSTNSTASALTPFPPLWLNELEADNLTGITNRAGQRAGWLELFNPSTNVVSLNGLYLANNYTNLLQWAFPAAATIDPGQFQVVFADGQTNLTITNELHTGFSLASGSGALALTRLAGSQQQVLDYVNYTNLALDHSYGSSPDGQSFIRRDFYYPTPGGTNNGSIVQPPSFIAYSTPGLRYTQNFDSLPNPGTVSVNTANPVTISGITYSLANPFDFAFPQSSTSSGGLGLAAMNGWYGSGVLGSKFGANEGDQTTGGQLSFGLPSSANRALGLLATSSTGSTAFGARFINATTSTLTRMDLQFTGAVWRQSSVPKTLQFFYRIDLTGTNTFPTSATAFLPGLNVSIPTVAADSGGVAVDGTSALNQTNLSVLNETITNWPPGAALWLVWQMTDSAGKAQGLSIDNLSFSANVAPGTAPLSVTFSSTNMLLSWPSVAGQDYQLEYKNDLAASAWTPLGGAVQGTGGTLTVGNSVSDWPQCYFRLRLVNN